MARCCSVVMLHLQCVSRHEHWQSSKSPKVSRHALAACGKQQGRTLTKNNAQFFQCKLRLYSLLSSQKGGYLLSVGTDDHVSLMTTCMYSPTNTWQGQMTGICKTFGKVFLHFCKHTASRTQKHRSWVCHYSCGSLSFASAANLGREYHPAIGRDRM